MSYSSCGEADGGSVASCTFPVVAVAVLAPVLGAELGAVLAAVLGGGGNCSPPGGRAAADLAAATGGWLPGSAVRSSGAPASRPPGAPTGGTFAAFSTGGATAASLPSTRGAPGAFGCRAGSNASERRPDASTGAFAGAGACGDMAGCAGCACGAMARGPLP